MLDPRQDGLLDRILASRHFSHAESLKRVLCYICENSSEAKNSVREYQLGVEALGRPSSFDPRTDPIVRVSVDGIRERLRSYFEEEGSREPVRLEIPVGEYRAVYKEVSTSEVATTNRTTASAQFWRPYTGSNKSNVLVYSEVLFFRDDQGNYVRNVYVNDVGTGDVDIRPYLPAVDFDRFSPSYHFASAGDMHCVLFIAKQFQDLGAGLDVRTSRFTSWNQLGQSNLIFIGSCRTSPFIDSLQGEQPFVLTPTSIRNRYPKDSERSEYVGRRYTVGRTEHLTEYALITRHAGLSPDTATTIISGNHGRAIEAAGFLLTREDAVERMLTDMGVSAGGAIPPRFQILVEVGMADYSEDVVSVEYLTHRIF